MAVSSDSMSDLQSPENAATSEDQRSLPPREVTDERIADAYTKFILYCNPHFPLDVDATELKRIFRSPPRSDGKDFSIYTLWELIQKFDSKEIKTWAQLALDLGVEPPSIERGGSVQKVQQYSVRLKRWMRAMHVDAFFEYLLGKRHTYFVDLPPSHDPHPIQGRDGVPAEEDLAIRALDPSFRPKRGRKRNESPDDEPVPQKRPLLTTSFTYEGQTLYAQPQSAHPASAIPLSARGDDYASGPWAGASAVSPNGLAQRQIAPQSAITARPAHIQWQLQGQQDTPSSAYPMSAIEPRASQAAFEEPRSAITTFASKSRTRRKHGPAVSSAWPSNGASSTSKLRGRPPANRIIQDGPFTTFLADPNAELTPSSQRVTPKLALAPVHDGRNVQIPPNTYMTPTTSRESLRRPERLQVQVPQHTGAPIRLATPSVVVNGERSASTDSRPRHETQYDDTEEDYVDRRADDDHEAQSRANSPRHRAGGTAPGIAYEALRRVLATDLLRAETLGRSQRILGGEASRLSDAILSRLGVPRADTESKNDDAIRLAAASWLGVSSQLGFNAGTPCKEKEITVHRFALQPDGSRTPLGPEQLADRVVEKYDVTWSSGFGAVGGRFCIVGVEPEPEQIDPEDPELRAEQITSSIAGQADRDVDWKGKYMSLNLTVRLMKGQLNRFQDKVLDALL